MDVTIRERPATGRFQAIQISVARAVVAAALLGGLALRLSGIGFGLPYEYHIDEQQYVRQAAAMGRQGLAPTWWNNPPVYKYVLFGEYAALYVAERVTGLTTSVADFGQRNTQDPSALYLLGRATSALLGTLTILLVYRLAKRAYGTATGAAAAVLLATCLLHVRESHFAVNDAAVTAIMTAAVLIAARIIQGAGPRWYVLGGVVAGVGFSTKYTAAAVILPLLLAWLLAPRPAGKRLDLRLPIVLVVVAAVAALAVSPYFILAGSRTASDVNTALVEPAQGGFDSWKLNPAGYQYYLESLQWGMGPVALLSLGGMIVVAFRRRPIDFLLLAYVLSFYLFMGAQSMYFARFILPIVPVLVIFAAELCAAMARRLPARYIGPGLAALVLLAALQPAVNSLRLDVILQRTDTRTLAKQWIEQNVPAGSRIAVDWPTHGPPLSTAEKVLPDSTRTYQVLVPNGSGLPEYTLQYYRQEGFNYLISSSYITNLRSDTEKKDKVRRTFYQALNDQYDLAAEFSPFRPGELPRFQFDELYGPTAYTLWQRERPGPVLHIYALDETAKP